MDIKNVILQVDLCGIGFQTALLVALKHTLYTQMDEKFVLL